MGLCGAVVAIPLAALVNSIGPSRYSLPLSWYVFVFAISYLLFALFVLATYPILFKLGYSKGKFWGLILPAVFMGLLYGTFSVLSHMPGKETLLLDVLQYASENMLLVSGGVVLLATLLMGLAIVASKRIYAKRDF